MRKRYFSLTENSTDGVAHYESMLDLFTIISFVLIVSAFLYVSQAKNTGSEAAVVGREAQLGSGLPRSFPNDVFLMIISRNGSYDTLSVVNGATGFKTNLNVTVDLVGPLLNDWSSSLNVSTKINIAVYEPVGRVNPGIYLAIQRWLVSHGYNNFGVYFTEE